MNKHVLFFLALAMPLHVQAAIYQITNPQQIVINDNAVATPYPSPITITTANPDERITKVTLTLNGLSHEFPSDIAIALESPTVLDILVMAIAGGGIPVNNLNLTFADSAANYLPIPLVTGTFKPTSFLTFPVPSSSNTIVFATQSSVLSLFNGQNPNGVWNLLVQDIALGGAGMIANGWTLIIETAINPSEISTAIKTKYCN